MTDQGRIWVWHLWFVAIWPILLVGGGAVLAAEAVLPAIAATAVELGAILLGGVTLVAGFVSLFGYREEARRFRDAGSDWVPTWWVWAVAHVLLSPFIAAPAYVFRRWRRVGLSM